MVRVLNQDIIEAINHQDNLVWSQKMIPSGKISLKKKVLKGSNTALFFSIIYFGDLFLNENFLSSTENNLKVVPSKSKSNYNQNRSSRLLNVPQLDGKHRNKQNSGDKSNNHEGFSTSINDIKTNNSYKPREADMSGYEMDGIDGDENMNDSFRNTKENNSNNRQVIFYNQNSQLIVTCDLDRLQIFVN